MKNSQYNLRRIYADICRGHSRYQWRGKDIYVKHLTHFDQVDLDWYYEESMARSLKLGLKTNEQMLKWLDEKKLWTHENEMEMINQKGFIENLEKTKKKLFLSSDIESRKKQIAEENKKYDLLYLKKNHLMGLTAELAANRRMQYYYIYLSFFDDLQLRNRLLKLNDIDELDDLEAEEILRLYMNMIDDMNHQNIKKISISSYFTNYFYICGDNIAAFFNKPMPELSVHQVNLLSYGLYFKNLLSGSNIPDDIRDDPDKIEEFITRNKNAQEAINKVSKSGGAVGIVGATGQDFKDLGITNNADIMHKAANKQYRNSMDAAKDMPF